MQSNPEGSAAMSLIWDTLMCTDTYKTGEQVRGSVDRIRLIIITITIKSHPPQFTYKQFICLRPMPNRNRNQLFSSRAVSQTGIYPYDRLLSVSRAAGFCALVCKPLYYSDKTLITHDDLYWNNIKSRTSQHLVECRRALDQVGSIYLIVKSGQSACQWLKCPD